MTKGIGYKSKRKGQKKKKNVAGNIIDTNIVQVNVAITKHGEEKFENLVKKAPVEKKDETKELSAKERLVQESLEKAGSEELAHEKTKPKSKKR